MSTDFKANSDQGVGPVVLPSTLKFGCWRALAPHGHSRWHSTHFVQPIGSPHAPRHHYLLKAVTRGLPEPRHQQAIDRLTRRVLLHELLQHQGIAPVLDAELDRFPFFIVEPYLAGRSLVQLGQVIVDWPISRTIWVARQVAETLNAVHHKGHAHLGLTPQKINVDHNGQVTLLGWNNNHRFGQKCWLPREIPEDVFTRAPETFDRDYRAQPSADIFSFGTILFFLFSGTWPTCGRTLDEIERQQKSLMPPELNAVSRCCPRNLGTLIMRMLAKNPLRRPTIETVVNALVSAEIESLGPAPRE